MHLLAVVADTNHAIVDQGLTARDWIVAAAIVVVGIASGRVVRTLANRAAHHADEARPGAAPDDPHIERGLRGRPRTRAQRASGRRPQGRRCARPART